MDAACPCARILWTTAKVIGTERDRATPRDASFSETRSIASCQRRMFVATSVSPILIGNQDIFSPSHPSIAKRGRNSEPFDASINSFSAIDEHSTSYFSGVIGVEIVSAKVTDVNPRKRINFASNPVFSETPKFVDLGMSPAYTTDKLKYVIRLAARAEDWLDHSDWIVSRHRIAEVTEDRVSKAEAYSDYIKKSEFETMNVFEQENNSGI